MSVKANKKLLEFNRVYREIDSLYHNIARENGISDSAFIILYCIREKEEMITQKDICHMCSMIKQTINTSLKKLESDGYIELKAIENNHRNKQIVFTNKGSELAKRVIDPIISAENRVLMKMSEDSETFLMLSNQYLSLLSEEFNKSLQTQHEEQD